LRVWPEACRWPWSVTGWAIDEHLGRSWTRRAAGYQDLDAVPSFRVLVGAIQAVAAGLNPYETTLEVADADRAVGPSKAPRPDQKIVTSGSSLHAARWSATVVMPSKTAVIFVGRPT
jgi:hypothetical protein